MNVSVIVASFGSRSWAILAERAAASIETPDGMTVETIAVHENDSTLASVRNAAAAEATGDWLCFLDADDRLAPGYLAAMRDEFFEWENDAARPMPRYRGTPADVDNAWPLVMLTPSVAEGHGDRWRGRRLMRHAAVARGVNTLADGNWLVIGTLLPRALFLEVGGFEERWELFEDWALFARCWKAGAEPVDVPDAVYLAQTSSHSRNRKPTRAQNLYWHQAIGHDVFPDRYHPTTAEEDRLKILRSANLRLIEPEAT